MKSNGLFVIRHYRPSDENSWLRCRVLAFLDTPYFDDVCRKKEQYSSRAIELVAEVDNMIVGLIDVECVDKPETICLKQNKELAGMIWHFAVHPDYQRCGIGSDLLSKAKECARVWGINCFEVWTRDGDFAEQWYRLKGFEWVESYYHIYIEYGKDIEEIFKSDIPGLRPLNIFAHYVGNDIGILSKFRRIYKCSKYKLCFGN